MNKANHKPLAFLTSDRIRTPPVPKQTRRAFGLHLRALQRGETLAPPLSKPMRSIGPRCHEIRLSDETGEWRLIYQTSPAAIRVIDFFHKTTQKTPKGVIDRCRARLAANPE